MVLYIEASDDSMTQRLLNRGLTSGRVDDNIESIQERLKTFHNVTQPVIEYYEKQGKLKVIDSEQEPDEVFVDVSCVYEGKPSKDFSY
jgi:adenylate kinase family enzyme